MVEINVSIVISRVSTLFLQRGLGKSAPLSLQLDPQGSMGHLGKEEFEPRVDACHYSNLRVPEGEKLWAAREGDLIRTFITDVDQDVDQDQSTWQAAWQAVSFVSQSSCVAYYRLEMVTPWLPVTGFVTPTK